MNDGIEKTQVREITKEQLFAEQSSVIEIALGNAKALQRTHPSRGLSVVITKLEEAEMWLTKCD